MTSTEIDAKKSSKKRKVSDLEANGAPDTSAAVVTEKKSKKKSKSDDDKPKKKKSSKSESASSESETQKKSKKTKKAADDEECDEKPAVVASEAEEDASDETPKELRFSTYRICDATVKKLTGKGITALFPIQASTFNAIYDGKDVVGRARTGTGKTLSFALPVTERLLAGGAPQKRGRSPRVLVMCPTRELARQVAGEFESIASANFSVLTVYGGVPYYEQERGFSEGIDILVGTPGRIMDHLDRGRLRLESIEFAILDEADQMLDIGFADAMEKILKAVQEQRQSATHQTLLFSATLPPWVSQVTKKYLRQDAITVDLVGSQKLKTNENIKHLAIQCFWQQRAATISDVVRMYGGGRGGRAIIFTETKNEANELALGGQDGMSKMECQVLHGDIAQKQRETTLKGFRDGKFNVLVATDVAARGIDIPDVDLVIQCNPPKDVDTFTHRSGRTGRAGKKGTCITFFKPVEEWSLNMISKRVGVQFARIGAPQSTDLVQAAAHDAVKSLNKIDAKVLPYFLPLAKELLDGTLKVDAVADIEDSQERSEKLLAFMLASLSGHAKPPTSRSLITCSTGFTTMILRVVNPVRSVGYFRSILSNQFPEIDRDAWKSFRMLKDSQGAVFDIDADRVDEIMEWWQERSKSTTTTLEVVTTLPELQERDLSVNFNGGGGGGQSYNNQGGNRGYTGGRFSKSNGNQRGGHQRGGRFGGRVGR